MDLENGDPKKPTTPDEHEKKNENERDDTANIPPPPPIETPSAPPAPSVTVESTAQAKEQTKLQQLRASALKIKSQLLKAKNIIEPLGSMELSADDRKKTAYLKDGFSSSDRKNILLNAWPHVLMWSEASDLKRTIGASEMKALLEAERAFDKIYSPVIEKIDRILSDMAKFDTAFNVLSRAEQMNNIKQLADKVDQWQKEADLKTLTSLSPRIKESRLHLITAMEAARKDALSRPESETKASDEDHEQLVPWEARLGAAFVADFKNKIRDGQVKNPPNFKLPGQGINNQLLKFIMNVIENKHQYDPKTIKSIDEVLDIVGAYGLSSAETKRSLEVILQTRGYTGKSALLKKPFLDTLETILTQNFQSKGDKVSSEEAQLTKIAAVELSVGSSRVAEKGSLMQLKQAHQKKERDKSDKTETIKGHTKPPGKPDH